jgi:hypothetical protein
VRRVVRRVRTSPSHRGSRFDCAVDVQARRACRTARRPRHGNSPSPSARGPHFA